MSDDPVGRIGEFLWNIFHGKDSNGDPVFPGSGQNLNLNWHDKPGNGLDPMPNVDAGNDRIQPHPGGAIPVDPGMAGQPVAPGWYGRAGARVQPVFGPQRPYLTDAQARAMHLMWSVTNQTGDTAGYGKVTLVDNKHDGGVGRLDKDAPAVGMPDQGPDGNVPWPRLGPDGYPMTAMQEYEADLAQRVEATKDKGVDSQQNIGLYQDYLRIDHEYEKGMADIVKTRTDFVLDKNGRPIILSNGQPLLQTVPDNPYVPGAPRPTMYAQGVGHASGNETTNYRNDKLRGEGGAALME